VYLNPQLHRYSWVCTNWRVATEMRPIAERWAKTEFTVRTANSKRTEGSTIPILSDSTGSSRSQWKNNTNFTHAQSRREQVRWQETGAEARVADVRNTLTSTGTRNIVVTTGEHPTESMTLTRSRPAKIRASPRRIDSPHWILFHNISVTRPLTLKLWLAKCAKSITVDLDGLPRNRSCGSRC
jgi:hypothetical protein